MKDEFADRPSILDLVRCAGRKVGELGLNPWASEPERTPATRAWLSAFATSDELRAWVPVTLASAVWSAAFGRRIVADLTRRLEAFGATDESLGGLWRRANELAPAGYLVGVHPLEGHFGLWRIPREVRGRPIDNDLLAAIWDGRVAFVTF